jgi:nucleotide-binding universal stress UspA family protein
VRITVWLAPSTWVAGLTPLVNYPNAEITLMCVVDAGVNAAVRGGYTGLLGRGKWGRPPTESTNLVQAAAATALLDEAEKRIGRATTRRIVTSEHPEREVVAACADTDLLVLVRDGDKHRLGPRSLGRATRFVLDHAPCQILLIWAEAAPSIATIPPLPAPERLRKKPPG